MNETSNEMGALLWEAEQRLGDIDYKMQNHVELLNKALKHLPSTKANEPARQFIKEVLDDY